jgi:hypothetical protein
MTTPNPLDRRFCYPTPGWLVVLSLTVTGILFLSERFQWFPFNTHKGWTVLIAVAAVGVVLVLMFLWFVIALLLPVRLQFGIRSLLAATVAVAIPFSWLATSERFHWFPFANRQGWSVFLILMAAGVAILLVPRWVIAIQWRRWLLPFRWGLLLALLLATTMPCIWLGETITQARRQADILVALQRKGVLELFYDDNVLDSVGNVQSSKGPPAPSWLLDLIGSDFFGNVIKVSTADQFTDDDLELVQELSDLQDLGLGNARISDAGLDHDGSRGFLSNHLLRALPRIALPTFLPCFSVTATILLKSCSSGGNFGFGGAFGGGDCLGSGFSILCKSRSRA